MSGRKQSKETQANNQIQAKKKPATELGPMRAQPNSDGLPGPLFTSVAGVSVQMQAARLGGPRFPGTY